MEPAAEAPRAVSEHVYELSGNKEIKNKEVTKETLRVSLPYRNNGPAKKEWAPEDLWLKNFLETQTLLQLPDGVTLDDPKW